MAEAVGNEIVSLKRIRFGSLGPRSACPKATPRKLGAAQVKALWKDSRLE